MDNYLNTTNFNDCWTMVETNHQFYRLYCVYNLLKNYQLKTNTKYDYLVKIRPDTQIKQNILPLFDILETSNIKIIMEHDQMAILKYELKDIFKAIKQLGRYQKRIDTSTGIFLHFTDDREHFHKHYPSTTFCPERQFMEHVNDIIIKNNLNFNESFIGIRYPSFGILYRGNGIYGWGDGDNFIPRKTIEDLIYTVPKNLINV